MCQDTGTATIVGKKGQQVWTDANDAEWLSRGVYDCYTKENLRYSQVAPLDLWKEVNTGTNLPAQVDLYATEGANTSSSSSPRAAAPPTRRSSTRRPRRS